MDIPQRQQAQFNTTSMISAADLLSAYCNYPTDCICLALSFMFLIIVVVLVNATLNSTVEFGVIKQDFSNIGMHDTSNIRSEFDDMMGKIDHWCLYGGNDGCRCEDPLLPLSRLQYKTWVDTHMMNKNSVNTYVDSQLLGVAFLGDSLVEEMDGHWLGNRDDSDELKAIRKIFAKRFKRQTNPDNLEGVALGIAGDTTPNVLWRILQSEMLDRFNPKVWWISLGMDDLGRSQCSEEVVVLGILRVVEEIRLKKPDARIVINSLLPMADLRGGPFPLMTEYRDAFRQGGGHPYNPRLNPYQHKIKKYDAHKLFLTKNRLPLWTSIHAINDELKKICERHYNVTFFDATYIFTERTEDGQDMLLSDLVSIRGHPTVQGFEKWEDAILAYLKKLLPKKGDSQPAQSLQTTQSMGDTKNLFAF